MSIRRTTIATPVRFEAPHIAPPERAFSSIEREREELRSAARRAGREEGLRDASAEVDATLARHQAAAARLDQAAAALEAAAADLRERDALTLRSLEAQVIELAVRLAEEVIGAELQHVDDRLRTALGRAIALTPDRGAPLVRVHPDDSARVAELLSCSPSVAGRMPTIVADSAVEPGGCVVEVGECRIDAQLAPALQRLRVVLST